MGSVYYVYHVEFHFHFEYLITSIVMWVSRWEVILICYVIFIFDFVFIFDVVLIFESNKITAKFSSSKENKFLSSIENKATFIKEAFDAMLSLESDEMTLVWSNDS